MNEEIKEILQYLSKMNTYSIFGGFAAYIYTKINHSNDIDVFVDSKKEVDRIVNIFVGQGWKEYKKRTKRKAFYIVTLIKNKTTFDICYYKYSSKMFINKKNVKVFNNFKLKLVSQEALFITKLNYITFQKSMEKTDKERMIIEALRKQVNVDKLKTVLNNLSKDFWLKSEL